jgi:mannose-6-phosphate isomerase-like protein (cupin superfamily)
MSFPVRRVVTGHDANGRAVAIIDEVATNVISRRPGHSSHVVWTTGSWPIRNEGSDDASAANVGRVMANGTVFRIIKLDPMVAPKRHRTDSIDYAVILAGEVDLELDDQEFHLRAGDVVVQRGTIHNWKNTGTEPCLIAVVLIHAEPVKIGDKVLNAIE